jgi:hypothetical protein
LIFLQNILSWLAWFAVKILFKLATDPHRRAPADMAAKSGYRAICRFGKMARVCVRLCVSSERSERVANIHAQGWRNALAKDGKASSI